MFIMEITLSVYRDGTQVIRRRSAKLIEIMNSRDPDDDLGYSP